MLDGGLSLTVGVIFYYWKLLPFSHAIGHVFVTAGNACHVFAVIYYVILFFFSSRRRHTRFDCDWSSDVCSSDLSRVLERERDTPLEGRNGRGIDLDHAFGTIARAPEPGRPVGQDHLLRRDARGREADTRERHDGVKDEPTP